MINQSKHLVLKSIRELSGYQFFIPAYQRGYRWTETEVQQLLEDIWEFSKKKNKDKVDGEFYCLQPIVAKRYNDNQWEIIDGQQRLTTIFIILKYLEDIYKLTDSNFRLYSIKYSTRPDSTKFLDTIKSQVEGENIDFFFMKKAYDTVEEWFEKEENGINKLDFLNTLIKQQIEEIEGIEEEKRDVSNNVRVIWYEVEDVENNNSIDIFTRLNIGKIPLTNAELIKAMLLQKGNFSKDTTILKQIQIASEWDIIEKTLQDDAFWFFIYNPNNYFKYDNRIEYIFDLMKDKTSESEYYHTFKAFYKDYNVKNNKFIVDELWLKIKTYFLTIEEWYKDYELFHYVGYLIDCGVSINTIKKECSNKPKDIFKNNYLIDEIKKQVRCDIDNVEYKGREMKFIKKILLLFNIQTVLETQKSDMRFPFHKYKSDNWDIEHICSRTDKTISSGKQSLWIDDIMEYFVGVADIASTKEFINQKIAKNENRENDSIILICRSLIKLKEAEKIEESKFNDCFELVRKYFGEDNQKEDKNSISNLTLLDATTNRSYGNSFFPIKRKRIIENDSKGIFVPITTKNLFLKYYSKQLGNMMYWTSSDADDYFIAIKNTLNKFLPNNNE